MHAKNRPNKYFAASFTLCDGPDPACSQDMKTLQTGSKCSQGIQTVVKGIAGFLCNHARKCLEGHKLADRLTGLGDSIKVQDHSQVGDKVADALLMKITSKEPHQPLGSFSSSGKMAQA
mmetsp:Transcript_3914/g.9351  ORF Transcript_3914/g.9351 Transcript_3914/m.9351 type:complete len:119 (+) Transcript_3914:664-1020(+)